MRDIYSRDMRSLKTKKLFLFDMDGTLYLGGSLFPGAAELLALIREAGKRYVFVTNNSSKSAEDYCANLVQMGIPAAEEDLFSSVEAAAFLLKQRHPGEKIYVQGTRSLLRRLRALGIRAEDRLSEDAGAVLVGFDTELTFEKLVRTVKMLKRPVPYYATNPDLVCPVEFGSVPDCGSMCISLENASGRRPEYIGKPAPLILQLAMKRFGCGPEETVVVGDRLYTDIASGANAGVDTVCVLSGEASLKDIEASEVKPSYVVESVACLQPLVMEEL